MTKAAESREFGSDRRLRWIRSPRGVRQRSVAPAGERSIRPGGFTFSVRRFRAAGLLRTLPHA